MKMECFQNQTYFCGPLSALQLESSPEERIYKDMMSTADVRTIEEFNYFVNYGLRSIFCRKNFVVSENLTYRVTKVTASFPTTTKLGKETLTCLLTPNLARLMEQDYVCMIKATIQHLNRRGEVIKSEQRVIGNIPCPIGSCRCVTSYKPDEISSLDEWKLMCGEDPSKPIGIFIKNGAQKVFLLGEKLKTNTNFTVETMGENPRIKTQITEMSNSKTTIMRIESAGKSPKVKIFLSHLKGKHYPLFFVLYFLSINKIGDGRELRGFSLNDHIEIIARMAPPNEYENIKVYLANSKIAFIDKFYTKTENGNIIDPEKISAYISKKNKSYKKDDKKKKSKINVKDDINRDLQIADVTKAIANEISPYCRTESEKIANLAIMTCQHIRCCLKLRDLDNRDSWANKKLDTPVRLIEQSVATDLVQNLIEGTGDVNSWRVAKSDKKGEMMESMKVDSNVLERALLTKINAPVDPKTKKFKVRAVAPSGYNTICLAKTSEGEKCGINKHIASCVWISVNSEHLNSNDLSFDRLSIIFDQSEDNRFSDIQESEIFGYKVAVQSDGTGDIITDVHKNPIYVSLEFITLFMQRNSERMDISFEESIMIITVPEFSEFPKRFKMWNESIIELNIDQAHADELEFMLSIINDSFATSRNELYSYLFTYNGNVLLSGGRNSHDLRLYPKPLWVNPNLLIPKFKIFRRFGSLPKDCCIFKNEIDQIVQYYDDSGRLMFPCLVADENGDLIFDQISDINIWKGTEILDYGRSNERLRELYDSGAMEYIDSKELDTIFMADTIDEMRRFSKLRKMLNDISVNEIAPFMFPIVERKFQDEPIFMCEDMSFVTYRDKKYEVIFTKIPSKSIAIADLELYAKISINVNHYNLLTERVYEINEPENCQKRDGHYLFYLNGDELVPIPVGSVRITDEKYNGEFIIPIKIRETTVYRIIKEQNGRRYLTEFLDNSNYVRLQNEGHSWFRNSGKVEWSENSEYDFYGATDFNNHVDFENVPFGEIAFFRLKTEKIYIDIIESPEIKLDSYDEERENRIFDAIRAKDTGDRECDMLMAQIRRNQEVLDQIFEKETYDFSELQVLLPIFMKKSNIYKVKAYLNWRFKFTHCPINPNLAYSSVANLVPQANHNQGPRFTYQCAMATQAIGLGNVMHFMSFETSIKRLMAPKQHLFETIAEEPMYTVTMPTRENFILAILTNQEGFEDALVMSKWVFKLFARYEREVTIVVIQKDSEMVGKPVDSKGSVLYGKKYDNLDENGIAKVGSIIEFGDVIVGQSRIDNTTQNVIIKDISRIAQIGEDGIVTQVSIISNEESSKEKIIRVKIYQRRFVQPGDKFAAPYSQKGTIASFIGEGNTDGEALKYESIANDFLSAVGEDALRALDEGKIKYKVVDANQMPRVIGGPNDGMAIHVLFSPFSFPSRMTMGMNFEMFTGSAALRLQKKINASSFHKINVEYYQRVLIENGLDRDSCEFLSHRDGEVMMDSTTGKPLKVFIAPCSYQVLKHHAIDKRSVRVTGRNDRVIRQPVGGRKIGGAQRFGEMERDAMFSHGAPGLLLDRLKYASDIHTAIFCKSCGNRTPESDIIGNICKICDNHNCLVSSDQTRVFAVFSQNLRGMGVGLTMDFEKTETI